MTPLELEVFISVKATQQLGGHANFLPFLQCDFIMRVTVLDG